MRDSKSKELFEFSQGMLEFNTEGLHKSLIDGHLELLIEADSVDIFNSLFQEFKDSVNKKKDAINKYRKNLINEMENKYIGDLDNNIINLEF